ncbi:hypothetical protein [Paraburkholderia domus]|uniref:hypothetical protein n=1 Tax=Paraburkholderia domus TaxID=2793075 RepID=UPI001911E29E|nr:hypothetical protein [Paraburkholderia domus]MBK5064859.1 hypothetical protein [Burkholderia sp. R-70199]CAE6967688.1 hypothetical protein R70199_07873 [Paraburkholderia domus]
MQSTDVQFKGGTALLRFDTSIAAIRYAKQQRIGNYATRDVKRAGVDQVEIEWIPDPSVLPGTSYPQFSDLEPRFRQMWEAQALSTHRGWSLCLHDAWFQNGWSRYVLVQSVALVTFAFPTGNEEIRRKARLDALIFADANPFKAHRIGKFCVMACPQAVYFTAALHAAGWVRGEVATVLNEMIAREDAGRLDGILTRLSGYTPKDHTQSVEATLAGLMTAAG